MIKETIELLLQGEFICPITYHKSYEDLKDEESFKLINNILEPLGRYVANVPGSDVYYAAWKNIDDNNVRKQISKEFTTVRDLLRPTVEFILTIMDLNMQDYRPGPGFKISESETTSKIENNDFFKDRVSTILQIINKRKTTDPLPLQVKALFDYMKKNNILIEEEDGCRQFQLTGKISYIYAVIDYIDAHEHILSTEEKNGFINGIQGDLFSEF
ncbi:MAG: hypothetical protein ACI4V7_12480 [Succinivibrionaceae bacterium]